MCNRQRRIAPERGLVGGDGALQISAPGELFGTPEHRRGIIPQIEDAGQHWICERGPARPVARVAFQRTLRFLATANCAQRERECVVGRTPFRIQRDCALERGDGIFLPAARCSDPPEPETRRRFSRRDTDERIRRPAGSRRARRFQGALRRASTRAGR